MPRDKPLAMKGKQKEGGGKKKLQTTRCSIQQEKNTPKGGQLVFTVREGVGKPSGKK